MKPIDVVVRCRNEMPHTVPTLDGLARQTRKARVLFLDCGSTDGSREAAVERGVRIHDIDPKAYVPGVVLNLGMRMTESDVVAFVNADAIPLHDDALEKLIAPLANASATYARQVARPTANARTRADYARAFGDQPLALRHAPFFSMAASALRRDVWQAL